MIVHSFLTALLSTLNYSEVWCQRSRIKTSYRYVLQYKIVIMPKSKRARVVPTSKTKKDRKELVRRLHANIQSACDQYDYIWVFEVANVRNSNMKEVRSRLSDSRCVEKWPSSFAMAQDQKLIWYNVAEYSRAKQN